MSVCLRCGYDLRATPPESPCPECGLAAHRSVFEHVHPDDCPPGWVRSIAVGATLLLISYLGFGALLAACTFFSDVLHNAGILWLMERHLSIWDMPPWIVFGLLGLSILHGVANVLLSRDEKSRKTQRMLLEHRLLLWAASTIPIVGLGLGGYWSCFPPRYFANYNAAAWLVNWLILPLLLCPVLTFFRLRRLAQRLSRPRLAEHLTIVAVGCAASLVVLGLSSTTWSDLQHGDAFFFAFMAMPWVFVWLFDLWATALLFVVVNRFWRSAKESRARWRAADASMLNN
jgi:hypothetical protein